MGRGGKWRTDVHERGGLLRRGSLSTQVVQIVASEANRVNWNGDQLSSIAQKVSAFMTLF